MSTAPASLSPAWKQEVNRRIAEHRNRKPHSAPESDASSGEHRSAGSRAAEAAARVAERFANAPSYSEMLAGEARAAVRAAEFASRAALHAQAAAEQVLAGLEAASAAEPEDALEPPPTSKYAFWDPEPVLRPAAPGPVAAPGPIAGRQFANEQIQKPPIEMADAELAAWQHAEQPQPVHANLIEFPRELVATRKVRPRIAEGPYGGVREPGAQLSIFEVEADAVSTLPAAAEAVAAPAAPAWTEPEWSGIELAAQPAEEFAESFEFAGEVTQAAAAGQGAAAEQAAAAPALELAPMSRRLLAVVMDSSLIVVAFLAAAFAAAANARVLPGPRAVEIGATAALLVVAALYHALFFTLARATPGMKYARIRLSTLDGELPTREQRSRRLAALLLSVLPVGLGLVWAVFDEDHLSWHDRLSQTYLRRS